MSTAVSKIDTKVISEAVVPMVSKEQAEAWLKAAGLPHEIDLNKFRAASEGGKYLAQDSFGYITTRGVLDMDLLDDMRRVLHDMVKSKDKKRAQKALMLLKSYAEASEIFAARMLKMTELQSARNTTIERQQRAPAGPDMQIQGSNVVIQLTPQQPEIEAKTS